MIKSGKRIQFELIKLVIAVFLILLVVTAINFYLFLFTILPTGIITQKENVLRMILFGIVTVILLFGITWSLVKLFTYHLVGPIPRLKREIREMVETG
ncbi:MAG: hypothetical protein QME68_03515, partial [Elusimicrobiota bacterium]|nr:hypothetical protein [Elusimicrobiota bacterium]